MQRGLCCENGYACGEDDADQRCTELCGGVNEFGGPFCFDGNCDGSGCALNDRAGPCCFVNLSFAPFTAVCDDTPETNASKKSKSSSGSSTLIIMIVVVVAVAVAITHIYFGKLKERNRISKSASTVDAVSVDAMQGVQLAEVQEAKAGDDTAGAVPVKPMY